MYEYLHRVVVFDVLSCMQSEAALAMALEASRNESAALRIAYQYAQDKYKETQQQLDTLLQQLKEEGATLKQRDKDRFKGMPDNSCKRVGALVLRTHGNRYAFSIDRRIA